MSSSEQSTDVPLHTRILIGLTVGIVGGILANWLMAGEENKYFSAFVLWVEAVGKLFLRLMTMVVIPLVFSALALAIVEIGSLKKLGRMGLRTLGFTALLSASAVCIGLVLVNFFQPGKSISEEQRTSLTRDYAAKSKEAVENSKKQKPIQTVLIDLFPENPLQEMVGAIDGSSKGDGMLAVMVFSLIVGMALTTSPVEAEIFVGWLKGLQLIASVVIGFAMNLAPYGAGCLVFAVTAKLGLGILYVLLAFVLTALGGLLLHLFVTYSIVLTVFARMAPWKFFDGSLEALLTAFGTSSSNATLPTAMRVAQTDLGLPSRVSNFVLTVGATGNQNGTALFEGVVVLFLAQVMGVHLDIAQQLQVVLLSILAGIGTAGVPGGSLPLIVVVMESVGIPGASIGIVMGVDRILDMSRTVVNVAGDLVIATCVARTEPADDPNDIVPPAGPASQSPAVIPSPS